MTISTEQILTVIGGGSTLATAIFWAAFYMGKITGRLERVEQRVDDLERIIERRAEARP